jgi:hypothetical protein
MLWGENGGNRIFGDSQKRGNEMRETPDIIVMNNISGHFIQEI